MEENSKQSKAICFLGRRTLEGLQAGKAKGSNEDLGNDTPSRKFSQHGLSLDWMKYLPEIAMRPIQILSMHALTHSFTYSY